MFVFLCVRVIFTYLTDVVLYIMYSAVLQRRRHEVFRPLSCVETKTDRLTDKQ